MTRRVRYAHKTLTCQVYGPRGRAAHHCISYISTDRAVLSIKVFLPSIHQQWLGIRAVSAGVSVASAPCCYIQTVLRQMSAGVTGSGGI